MGDRRILLGLPVILVVCWRDKGWITSAEIRGLIARLNKNERAAATHHAMRKSRKGCEKSIQHLPSNQWINRCRGQPLETVPVCGRVVLQRISHQSASSETDSRETWPTACDEPVSGGSRSRTSEHSPVADRQNLLLGATITSLPLENMSRRHAEYANPQSRKSYHNPYPERARLPVSLA